MSRFKDYLEIASAMGSTISTANVQAPGAGQVGTIRKIKRLKNGKFEYTHADPVMQITTKNPDGSVANQPKIKGANEVRDYSPEGIFIGAGKEGSNDVKKSIKEGLIGIQKRSMPTINRKK